MAPSEWIVQALAASDTDRRRLIQAHTATADDIVRELAVQVGRLTRTDPRQAADLATLATQVVDEIRLAPAIMGLARRAQAHALRAQGRYADSLPIYETAVTAFVEAQQPAEAARTQLGQLASLMYLGRHDEALALADQARRVFRQYRDRRNLATLNLNTGIVYHRLDRYRDALRYLDRAYRGYRALNDTLAAATVDVNRGNSLTQMGRFRAALQAYERARPVLTAQNMDAWGAMTDGNLGFLHFVQGHYNAALNYLLATRETFVRLGSERNIAIADLDLSQIYLVLNQLQEASALCTDATAIFDRLGMSLEAAQSRVQHALALLGQERAEAALTALETATPLFNPDTHPIGLATATLYRAQALLAAGRPADARLACDAARRVFETHDTPSRLGVAHVLAGRIATAQNDVDTAQAAYEQAAAIGRRLRQPWLLYQAHHGLGRLALARDPALARTHLLAAVTHLESVRAELQAEDLRLAFIGDKLDAYEDLVRLALDTESANDASVREAFGLVERARSRALLDLLAGGLDIRLRDAAAANSPALARLHSLRQELNGLYSLLARQEGTQHERALAIRAELRADIQTRETSIERLLRQLQVSQDASFDLQAVRAVTAEQVQSLLTPDETLVAFFTLNREVLAFVVHRDWLAVRRELADTREIADLTTRLRSQMAKFNFGVESVARHHDQLLQTATRHLQTLYNRLIRPLAPALNTSRLTIIPHGVMHYLPFHALMDGEQALIERKEVAYAPSASVLRHCRTATAKVSGPPLVLGITSPDIPYVRQEARAIASVLPDAAVYLDQAATADILRQASATSRLIHLASHAAFRPESPLFSAVRLADTWLTAHDVYNLELHADLVTLSACDTGVSQVAPGDDLLGLTRGFFYAGAKSLLVSLWAVNDLSTAHLMEHFYRRLQQGYPKATALRHSILAIKRDYAHPYHWAPFVLMGNGG